MNRRQKDRRQKRKASSMIPSCVRRARRPPPYSRAACSGHLDSVVAGGKGADCSELKKNCDFFQEKEVHTQRIAEKPLIIGQKWKPRCGKLSETPLYLTRFFIGYWILKRAGFLSWPFFFACPFQTFIRPSPDPSFTYQIFQHRPGMGSFFFLQFLHQISCCCRSPLP